MRLLGIHHLTAVTADAAGNHAFYTTVLGMRLVKKTVNQDDVSAYHLFYADGEASPGTDLTFFDWPTARERRGTRSVTGTGLRLGPASSLDWWQERLATAGVTCAIVERDGRTMLDAEDPEGQRLSFLIDGHGEGRPWARSPVPPEHQIVGLGPITMSVPDLAPTETVLREALAMRRVRDYVTPGGDVAVYEMGEGGPGAELHVREEPGAHPARQGAGGVHHVAFHVPDADYTAWTDRLADLGIRSSGPVDRYYFRSLYFREPGGVLFELATTGPGFAQDEPADALGETLALPPFLEPRRAEIERGLKPLVVGATG